MQVVKNSQGQLSKEKPLSLREQGLVEFLNDMKISKQDRIDKCIVRTRKFLLQSPGKPTSQT